MGDEWAFTVKYVKGTEDKDLQFEYETLFNFWKKNGVNILESQSHHGGENGRLHYHGIIMVKRGLYRKKLVKPGYHVKLTPIVDRAGWVAYMNKEHKLPQSRPLPNLFNLLKDIEN